MKIPDSFALVWFVVLSIGAFLAFGYDKWCARRSARRVPESFLVLMGAAGGWMGGLMGMLVFRHKTSKWTFWMKYGVAFIFFAAEVWAWRRWR